MGARRRIVAVVASRALILACLGRVWPIGGSGPHAIKRAMALLEWLIVAAAPFGGLVTLMYVAGAALAAKGHEERFKY